CGWAASHSLAGAKEIAAAMLENRSEWEKIFKEE
ncbi:MAG: S-ribosylhomocysteine lyase, partial [Alkalicoccus sp.]